MGNAGIRHGFVIARLMSYDKNLAFPFFSLFWDMSQ